MAKTRFQIAKKDIEAYFNDLNKPILRHADLAKAVRDQKDFWRLTQNTTVNSFIKEMLRYTQLEKIDLDFPSRKEIRYEWGTASIYQLLMSIREDAYLSHYSAVFLHELTEQIPKFYYLNVEQAPPRRVSVELSQSRINMAFKNKVRTSKNFANYRGHRIYVLNCMGFEQLGIITVDGPSGERIRVSNVERTLLDIAVRPIYAGGVAEVLDSFRRAREKVSVNKLASYLKKMGYIYPYHQVIGFYLEKSGKYSRSQIDIFRSIPQDYDFYLTHQMRETDYSRDWRLYYPKGM